MTTSPAVEDAPAPADPRLIAALFAVDPVGTAGVIVRSAAGPDRTRWLAELRACLPTSTPWVSVPVHADSGRLLGELDLGATLQAGRPIHAPGLVARAGGGVLILSMAERQPQLTLASVAAALDRGTAAAPGARPEAGDVSQLGVVALDEGDGTELSSMLADRLAFEVRLDARVHLAGPPPYSAEAVALARQRLPQVRMDDDIVTALCVAAAGVGANSLRTPLLAVRAARAIAALNGHERVSGEDAALAARLVIAHRATHAWSDPAPERPREAAREPEPTSSPPSDGGASERDPEDLVVAATRASVPAGLLDQLGDATRPAGTTAREGAAGRPSRSRSRGRVIGHRPGEVRAGSRLDLLSTLRAAVPWQRIRNPLYHPGHGVRPRLAIRRQDFRIRQYETRTSTLAIFAVDASGSSALHRLAEAKGAVEIFLADCYVRREQVALVAFRGTAAQLLLPPTRSLARAKRCLSGLPGGGSTPLAAALVMTLELTEQARRRGDSALAVILTDGRGNVTLGGAPDPAAAEQETQGVARRWKAARVRALVLDTSPRPHRAAQTLATTMGARYLPMPHAEARAMASAVESEFAEAR